VRFVAALAIAAAILGAVGWSQFALTRSVKIDVAREAHGHKSDGVRESAPLNYRLELTPTFDAAVDPFAVRAGPEDDAPRLLVRYAGADLLRSSDDLRRGEPVVLESVELRGALAELFVQASPSEEDARRACGLRVRLIREDGIECDDQTVWADAGTPLSVALRVKLTPTLARLDRGLGGTGP
jgi:hypothetical protein